MRYRCAALMPSRADEALKRSLPGSEKERDDDRGYRHQDVLVHGEGGHQLLDTHLDQTKNLSVFSETVWANRRFGDSLK